MLPRAEFGDLIATLAAPTAFSASPQNWEIAPAREILV